MKLVMHNAIAHHLEKLPKLIPKLSSLLPATSFPQYICPDVAIVWYQILRWLVEVSCSACVPSQLLVEINSILAEPGIRQNTDQIFKTKMESYYLKRNIPKLLKFLFFLYPFLFSANLDSELKVFWLLNDFHFHGSH